LENFVKIEDVSAKLFELFDTMVIEQQNIE